MLVIALGLILVGLFVAGWGMLLWIGIGVGIVGVILNLQIGADGRRWRYW